MGVSILIPILAFGTILAVIIFAAISQHKALERMQDSNSTKSTLASDKDSDGKPADV